MRAEQLFDLVPSYNECCSSYISLSLLSLSISFYRSLSLSLYLSQINIVTSITDGIPAVKWFGSEGDYNVLVIDLLGPSLEDLFNYCGKKFSLKTVLMLADQVHYTLYHTIPHHSSMLKQQSMSASIYNASSARNVVISPSIDDLSQWQMNSEAQELQQMAGQRVAMDGVAYQNSCASSTDSLFAASNNLVLPIQPISRSLVLGNGEGGGGGEGERDLLRGSSVAMDRTNTTESCRSDTSRSQPDGVSISSIPVRTAIDVPTASDPVISPIHDSSSSRSSSSNSNSSRTSKSTGRKVPAPAPSDPSTLPYMPQDSLFPNDSMKNRRESEGQVGLGNGHGHRHMHESAMGADSNGRYLKR